MKARARQTVPDWKAGLSFISLIAGKEHPWPHFPPSSIMHITKSQSCKIGRES